MTLYVGADTPESFSVWFSAGNSGVDLTTATSAEFDVYRPDNRIVSWSATVDQKQRVVCRLIHTFAVGELDIPGTYVLVPRVYLPSGSIRGERVIVPVQDPYGRK